MSNSICLDDKRRATFPPVFKPGDVFERAVQGNTVIFRKLVVAEAPEVKPVKSHGMLMLGEDWEWDTEKVLAAIREDRNR